MHTEKIWVPLAPRALTACAVIAMALASPFATAGGYLQQNLVTDDQTNLTNSGYSPAAHVDPTLINPWGISFGTSTPAWISNNGSGTSGLYRADGAKIPLDVTIPPPAGSPPSSTSSPTGQVFGGGAFQLAGQPNPSLFIFATEGGTIAQWNQPVSTQAQTAVDNSAQHTVYKGLAAGMVGNAQQLYATDFHNNKIDVFDQNFGTVLTAPGKFTDATLPVGYAPFGIQNINGDLFVTYAKQLGPDNHDDKSGIGHGFIDVFQTDGTLLKRFASSGVLNSPWGIALAPKSFGEFGGDLLVGNFGDGLINVFDPTTGAFVDHVVDAHGEAVIIDGLWALAFGNGSPGFGGGPTFDANKLYFTAGINGEAHGLFGSIEAVPLPATLPLLSGALGGLLGVRRRRRSARLADQ